MIWQKIIEWAKYFLNHKEQSEKHTVTAQRLERVMQDVVVEVERLAAEQDRQRENEVHEREKLAMRMEILLLRERSALPAPPRSDAGNEETLRLVEELKREIEELRRRLEEREQE